MNVVLKGFSQDVDLEHPDKVNHVLVFLVDGKKQLRLPVHEATITELVKGVYVDNAPQQAQATVDYSQEKRGEVEDEDLKDAEQFGGDYEEDYEEDPTLELAEDEEPLDDDDTPMSEDEVPSL